MKGECDRKTKNPMHEARRALKDHPKCGAHCRTTGNPCRNPSMANGRCRMHGGKSTGRPIVHGRSTKQKKSQYARARQLLMMLRSAVETL